MPKLPPPFVIRAIERIVNLLTRIQNALIPPSAAMMNMAANGLVGTQCIYVAAELGLADLFHEGPKTVEELAARTSTHAPSLKRLLRALAGMGLCRVLPDGRFGGTALGDALRSDAPGSMRSWVRYGGSSWAWEFWGHFLSTIKNGKSVHENLHGMRFFEWLSQHEDRHRQFNGAMSSVSSLVNPAVVAGYDFSGIGSLVDVAGGQGSLLCSILRATPGLRGTLFEQPEVISGVRAAGVLDEPDLRGRLSLAEGNFFVELPAGHDAYLFKWILHDWTDEECGTVLTNCRRAMGGPGKRLLIVEMILTPDNQPAPVKMMDMGMLLLTGGCERTAEGFAELLARNGFRLTRILPTSSSFSVIEGISV